MVTYLLNGAFIIFIIVDSLKQKKYRYTAAAVIAALYFIFVTLQNNPNLIANVQVFGWIQKGILVLFTGYMAFVLVKSADRKKDVPAFLFACVACVCRFLWTFVYNLYSQKLQIPGVDIWAVYQKFTTYSVLADSVTNYALIIVLFCIAWQLGNLKATNR